MLEFKILLDKSAPAGANLPRYRGVALNSDGKAILPASEGDRIEGVVIDRIGENEQARIVVDGHVPVTAGSASISKGDLVSFDTQGRAIPLGDGDEAGGIALQDAAAVGDVIRIRVSDLIKETGTA